MPLGGLDSAEPPAAVWNGHRRAGWLFCDPDRGEFPRKGCWPDTVLPSKRPPAIGRCHIIPGAPLAAARRSPAAGGAARCQRNSPRSVPCIMKAISKRMRGSAGLSRVDAATRAAWDRKIVAGESHTPAKGPVPCWTSLAVCRTKPCATQPGRRARERPRGGSQREIEQPVTSTAIADPVEITGPQGHRRSARHRRKILAVVAELPGKSRQNPSLFLR